MLFVDGGHPALTNGHNAVVALLDCANEDRPLQVFVVVWVVYSLAWLCASVLVSLTVSSPLPHAHGTHGSHHIQFAEALWSPQRQSQANGPLDLVAPYTSLLQAVLLCDAAADNDVPRMEELLTGALVHGIDKLHP